MKKDPDARPSADEVRLGLLEAGRGVHATEIYPEPRRQDPPEQSPPVPPRHRDRAPRKVRPVAQGGTPGQAGRDPGRLGGRGCARRHRRPRRPGLIGGGMIRLEANPRRTRRDRIRPEEGRTRRQEAVASRPPRSQLGFGRAGGRRSGTGERRFQRGASRREDGAGVLYLLVRRRITTGQPSCQRELAAEHVSNRATFEGTFDKVESVEFIEGPTAEVSGDTATVTGRTRATLTDRVEQNEGTWSLVKENGEWKIDGWTVNNIDSRPA